MEKDKLLRMIKEVIFEKVGEFNGLNHPESITNNDELGADMALDSLDFVEVVMEMEKRTGRYIPDEVLDVKPYRELTVGELTNMLYDYLRIMKRDELLEIVREEIFEKMHEFNYINNIEVIDDVREDSNLSSDLAMDPFDLLEVLIGIEEKMDIRIPDDVFGDKSVDELTVGIFVDMLYDWLESK